MFGTEEQLKINDLNTCPAPSNAALNMDPFKYVLFSLCDLKNFTEQLILGSTKKSGAVRWENTWNIWVT